MGSLAELDRFTPRRRVASAGWEGIGEGMWNVACEVEMGGRECAGGVWRSFAVDMVAMVSGLGVTLPSISLYPRLKATKDEDIVQFIRPLRIPR